MIQSLYRIGKVLQKEYPEYYRPWQVPYLGKEAKVIIANLNSNFDFSDNLIIQDKRDTLSDMYLYKAFNKGANIVPTFTVTDGKKTFDKFISCIEKYHFEYFEKTKIAKSKRKNVLNKKFKTLGESLKKIEIGKEDKLIFTIKIEDKWLGEIEYFKQYFLQNYNLGYYSKNYEGIKISKSDNYLCSVTGLQSEVYGFVDTLGFTVNDPTFNRNGFDSEASYKMFPVSKEAANTLEGSKTFALNKLSKPFYRKIKSKNKSSALRYFILPHFINVTEEGIRDALSDLLEKNTNTIPQDDKHSVLGNETLLHEIISDEKLSASNIYYDFLFYIPNKAQFLIKLNLSDVLPSRMSKIFKAKRSVEKFYNTENGFKIVGKFISFYISMSLVDSFFIKNDKLDTPFHPFFFKILESVFYGNKLNEKKLKKGLLDEIRQQFKQHKENKYKWIQRTYEAFTLWHFFSQLNLLNTKSTIDMTTQDLALNAFDFVEQHNDFFDNKFLRGLFFLGCATEKLLEKQRERLDSQPFFNQLNGLVITDKISKRVYNRLKQKITEYQEIKKNDKGHIYKNETIYLDKLISEITPLLLERNKCSIDDQSFAFISGLNMQKKFTNHLIKERKEAKDAAENKNK
jgi:CRISPR-associated Csh1 family protein